MNRLSSFTSSFFYSFALVVIVAVFGACSDDDEFSVSPSARLTFSRDSVIMDTVFSTVGSRTYDFWVFNRMKKGIRLQSVRLRQGNQTGFRVNVDGSYLDNTIGSVVNELEVREGDSIRVFVELTAPENGRQEALQIDDDLVFLLESGVEQRVALRGFAWDAIPWHDAVISRDSVVESQKPIVVYGGIRVDSMATLTLRNTTLYFHDKAGLDVYGKVKAENAILRGDRLDHMFDYLPYDRVSGQWRGVRICSSSFGNRFVDSEIRNAEYGIVCDSAKYVEGLQRLYMERSVIHNCKGPGLQAFNSIVGLLRCQFSNTLGDCLAVYGGVAVVEQCTLAQFYPLSADRGAALRFSNSYNSYPYPLHAMQMKGSIVTGYADDVVMGESLEGDSLTAFKFYFENSLLRTPAIEGDSIRFVDIRWETPEDSIQGKQHFRLIDEKNLIYDFHLDSLSTAKGLGCYD
ncbi:MAG: right-handed parallel beta-helix repeat-containing protein [Prevotella sp.]|nr:right-handed parallel beta-helix repeat-containing protein [Prevotella sp.]